MLNSGVNNSGVVAVSEMEGTADNKTGVDMLLTLKIAPLIHRNTGQLSEKPNTGKSVKKEKRKKKIPFLTRQQNK